MKDEEALISHRVTHLGGGSGITSSTIIYSNKQCRRKAEKNKKHLMKLEYLFESRSINLKEYLKLASSLVGKMIGEHTNTDNVDQTAEDENLVMNEDLD